MTIRLEKQEFEAILGELTRASCVNLHKKVGPDCRGCALYMSGGRCALRRLQKLVKKEKKK